VRVFSDYVNAKIEQNIVLDLRSDLFDHVTKLSLTYHDERHTGMLMGLINSQASALGAIVMSFPPIAESVLMLIGMLIIALLIDWQVTLVSLICIPFLYWAISLRTAHRANRLQRVEPRAAVAVDRLQAMTMLRVSCPSAAAGWALPLHHQERTAVDARVPSRSSRRCSRWASRPRSHSVHRDRAGFGAYHVLRGQITLSQMTVLISYIAAVYQPLAGQRTIGNLHQASCS
jgi:ABC-type multidrug transport system fused ATPase/permease subunit